MKKRISSLLSRFLRRKRAVPQSNRATVLLSVVPHYYYSVPPKMGFNDLSLLAKNINRAAKKDWLQRLHDILKKENMTMAVRKRLLRTAYLAVEYSRQNALRILEDHKENLVERLKRYVMNANSLKPGSSWSKIQEHFPLAAVEPGLTKRTKSGKLSIVWKQGTEKYERRIGVKSMRISPAWIQDFDSMNDVVSAVEALNSASIKLRELIEEN